MALSLFLLDRGDKYLKNIRLHQEITSHRQRYSNFLDILAPDFHKKPFGKLGAKKSTFTPFLKYLTSLPDNEARYAS